MGRLTNDWTLSLDNSDDLNQLLQALKLWEEGRSNELSESKIKLETINNVELDANLIKMQLERILKFSFSLESILDLASLKDKDAANLFGESFLNHLQRFKNQSTIGLEITEKNVAELTVIGNKTELVVLYLLISKFCRLNEYIFLIKS